MKKNINVIIEVLPPVIKQAMQGGRVADSQIDRVGPSRMQGSSPQYIIGLIPSRNREGL